MADHIQLFVAGNVPNAGSEEKFPDPDNNSKMRRSVENAEHVGLYLPLNYKPNPLAPQQCPGAVLLHRRHPLQGAGRLNGGGCRPRGVYLPPARATQPTPQPAQDFPKDPSRRVPFLIDTRNPYDPFAGRPSAHP